MIEDDEDTQEIEEQRAQMLHDIAMTFYRLRLLNGAEVDDMGYELCRYWM
jgi:hypothetical protein